MSRKKSAVDLCLGYNSEGRLPQENRYSSMKIKVFFPDPRSESSNILKDEINTDFHRFASTAVNLGKVPYVGMLYKTRGLLRE